MTILQRFLLLFADYREMRDREQRAIEEAEHWQALCLEARTKLEQSQRDAIDRERALNNNLMHLKYGDRINPDAPPREPVVSKEPIQPHQWVAGKWNAFLKDSGQYVKNGSRSNQ